ncbi:TPT-domain-containing protein [Pholiota conissans]|uniref:TPT-domain-containing protein n=1 Tax=Pholiota conissans TaxID=109636 RepID=A0A9P5ZEP6_9AGAR|nr:TPT-domain-containing protein [Pholiota conissans]
MSSTPPSFIFTSPSDRQLVIPSPPSTDPIAELKQSQRAPPASHLADKDLSTNAPATPPSRSRSVTPRPTDPMNPPPLPSQGYEKENQPPTAHSGRGHSSPKLPESDSNESIRILRGRALRVNTLHQRVYHAQDLSSLSCVPDTYSPLSAPAEIILDKEFLLPHSPPLLPSPSKTRFVRIRGPSLNRSPLGYLLRRTHAVPDSPQAWIGLYFVLNLTLTLYNKSVLIHFPFPYTLTAIHALCGTIGTFVLLRLESNESGARPGYSRLLPPTHMPNLNGKELIVVFLFSILYTVNIIVSNASLRLVTVPFHQVVRASTPFFTIMFSAMILGRRCSRRKLLSLIPVVAGVGFATYGDYYFTAFGFLLTLLGTLLAALKTTLTNVILVKPSTPSLPVSSESNYPISDDAGKQSTFPPNFFSSLAAVAINNFFPPSPSSSPIYPTKPLSPPPPLSSASFSLPKLTLSPLHLLYLLSPLAFIQTTLLAHCTGELDRVRWHLFNSASATSNGHIWLIMNGVLAFFLNVVSFNANRRVGPLGMSVAANVKQVLTILCAVVIFDLTITLANGIGIALTLLGGALYAAVELREKEERKSRVG